MPNERLEVVRLQGKHGQWENGDVVVPDGVVVIGPHGGLLHCLIHSDL